MEGTETLKQELLPKINQRISELGDIGGWSKTPEFPAGCENLKGRHILMVDDDRDQLITFIPDLTVATDGHAEFLHHRGEKAGDLVHMILEKQPEVVLMDFNLRGQSGAQITQELYQAGFTGKVIGFSSEPKLGEKFRDAGGIGAVEKRFYDVPGTLKDVVSCLSEVSE